MAVFSLLSFLVPAVLLYIIVDVFLLLNNRCQVTLEIRTLRMGKVSFLIHLSPHQDHHNGWDITITQL